MKGCGQCSQSFIYLHRERASFSLSKMRKTSKFSLMELSKVNTRQRRRRWTSTNTFFAIWVPCNLFPTLVTLNALFLFIYTHSLLCYFFYFRVWRFQHLEVQLRSTDWYVRNIIIRLAPRAGKMNQILRCDWLPEWARWNYLTRSGLPVVSRKKCFHKSHIINPLLTKLVRSRWLEIGLVRFLRVYGPRPRVGP